MVGLLRIALVGLCTALLVASARPAAAQSLEAAVRQVPSPRATGGWVHDGAGILGSRQVDINRIIDELEAATSAEIGVVILPSIGDEVPKDFAVALFKEWGIGKRDKDNGVLILHVMDQRRVEIEVGYGLEATITDSLARWIIDDITIPFFKQGSFADGHYETVRAVVRAIRTPISNRGALTSDLEAMPGQASDTGSPMSSPMSSSPSHDAWSSPAPMVQREGTPDGLVLGGLSLGLWMAWLLFMDVWGRRIDPLRAWRTYKWGGLLEYPVFGALGAGVGLLSGFSVQLALVLPIAMGTILAFGWRRVALGHFRNKPRTCASCGKPSARLDEVADNDHLEAGQVSEERVRSMDYDVWKCECGWKRVDPYKQGFGYSKCPHCSYRTYEQTGSQVITPATYDSTGTRLVTCACAHCGKVDTRHEVIPRKERPKPSSSSYGSSSYGSSSSSSSGRSWGGGRSGGGGAGGSY